jgi:16S rRNA (guanine966-N2)-methyltransferase
MRIISGEHRGRRIAAPPGQDTRPMLDRVREAMFSTLGQRIPGARILDLFAGSGSLGLEALSRGARAARMIEKDPRAIAVLKENVALLGLGERAEVVRGDALRRSLWSALDAGEGPDVVFLDPPYPQLEHSDQRMEILRRTEELLREVLQPGGCLVIHAPSRGLDGLRIPGGWKRDDRRYGGSGLLYLYKEAAAP